MLIACRLFLPPPRTFTCRETHPLDTGRHISACFPSRPLFREHGRGPAFHVIAIVLRVIAEGRGRFSWADISTTGRVPMSKSTPSGKSCRENLQHTRYRMIAVNAYSCAARNSPLLSSPDREQKLDFGVSIKAGWWD